MEKILNIPTAEIKEMQTTFVRLAEHPEAVAFWLQVERAHDKHVRREGVRELFRPERRSLSNQERDLERRAMQCERTGNWQQADELWKTFDDLETKARIANWDY